jgi:DNA repair protein RadC
MKEQIKGLIEYAKNPKYSEEGEDYLSDGEMLDIILEQLEKLIQ